MNKNDLLKFCDPKELREFITKPHHDGRNTWCSNGHLALRVTGVVEGVELSNSPIPGTFDKYAPHHVDQKHIELPTIPAAFDCKHCQGSGIEYHCLDCDGEGVDEQDNDCTSCNGSGIAKYKHAAKACSCWSCGGTGKMIHQPVQMPNGQHIARRYLVLLATLPGITVSTRPQPDDGFYHPLHFYFDGGEALCMPLSERGRRQ